MNATYIRIDLLRQLRAVPTMIFTIGLPSLMYLVFGAGSYGSVTAGRGNVAFYVMASMATYGAVTAAVDVAAGAAADATTGWGRTIALTRAPRLGYVLNKAAVAMLESAAAVMVLFAVGYATGARATWWVWPLTLLLAVVGSALLFCPFAIACLLLFSPENGGGLASGLMVLMSFAGNLFTPLSGLILDIAKWTPMYGFGVLVRWPQLEGLLINAENGAMTHDPLWLPIVSFVAWTVIFSGLAVWGIRKQAGRR